MSATASISIKGRSIEVTSASIDGTTVIITGSLLRVASIFDEEWRESVQPSDPDRFMAQLRQSGPRADIFTFSHALPYDGSRFSYPMTLENYAVAPTADYRVWWEERLPQESRKHVRKAQKLGVDVRQVAFNDDLIRGLKGIYDESPVRQGRRFWHYGKPLETIQHENSSYLDRSILVGAFFESELIGFLKLVRVGAVAKIMQIVAKAAHLDKKTTNALLAKGVELCAQSRIEAMIYGQYTYGKNTGGQLTEFKRRNGFEMVTVPRYHVPLTVRGRIGVAAGVHLGWRRLLPSRLERMFLDMRASYYRNRQKILDTRS